MISISISVKNEKELRKVERQLFDLVFTKKPNFGIIKAYVEDTGKTHYYKSQALHTKDKKYAIIADTECVSTDETDFLAKAAISMWG